LASRRFLASRDFFFSFHQGWNMNLYKFECTIWVRGETAEAALKELHDEALYHHLQDNNLCGLESDKGELVETEE
jgi:hypothetical protein